MDILTILIIVLVLALIGLGAWFLMREQRSRGLRQRFGPEYERSVALSEDRRAAESDLREREKRHRDLDVRPLDDEERTGFADRWTAVQQGFVDNPGQAVRDADGLVVQIMRARGYPVDDFEQRAADISVEHPVVAQRYREARLIADENDAGRAGTEDLRKAVTSYRALVVALLGTGTGPAARHDDPATPAADAAEANGRHVADDRHATADQYDVSDERHVADERTDADEKLGTDERRAADGHPIADGRAGADEHPITEQRRETRA